MTNKLHFDWNLILNQQAKWYTPEAPSKDENVGGPTRHLQLPHQNSW